MDVSVIIPTRGRPRKAAACVRALAAQTLAPNRYEVLVGLDGPDERSGDAVRRGWAGARPEALSVVECERGGYNAVRNRLLPRARGHTLISLNDDVEPAGDFLEVHVNEQRRALEAGRPAIIVGHSPWVPPRDDRLFDRLIRETSMVFFYDRMDDTDPDRDWGFRHAWGLNVSMPRAAAVDVGGWTDFPKEYGFDDIEIAWRLKNLAGLRVLYRPRAVAPHDHRISPQAYLKREFRLGRSAWLFAQRNPAFARDLFARDLTCDQELSYSRAFVQRERSTAARAIKTLERLAVMPADAADGPWADTWIRLAYEQHLPLKRWMWRAGLLAAEAGRPVDEICWPGDDKTRASRHED